MVDFKIFFIAFGILVASAVTLAGCDQWGARTGFGSMQTKVPCGQKLTNATWKGQNAELWTLTRPMRQDEQPEIHRFKASTLFGLLEGEVIFTESKC